ncbi:diguanylate cyclase (GGDEF) domain-containing protein [Ruminococcus sp. YE71]|uniref:sensor domain-containing diguanylate cyclase n=1 Tax=unclassified Ruminococcus TaxID=2608920 RepID=UPI00088AF888|nr:MULTISPECIES: diguanylate cyclase [unclassified Ruminococcus]SDA29356.1 diguanylate cyclase (GGDEF) domain-containing protein [Ruminococcus sp. YE78]SFW48109.1 diguanylate cyclase (GGDEF) domain-containing protein [Ruminococcus sp. YE71]
MKQLQFEYTDRATLQRDLRKTTLWAKNAMSSCVVIDIFTEDIEIDELDSIISLIGEEMPDALYRGCSTNGNIIRGGQSKKRTVIVCTIFEFPSTRVEMRQYALSDETEKSVTDDLCAYVKANSWVKGVSMLVTIRGMSMTRFCDDLNKLPDHVEVFGGGAFAADINNNVAYVFSGVGKCETNSVVFTLYGGEDLHIMTTHITGWKPLGRELIVTRAEGSVLYELDHKPAYDTYYHFLRIRNDEHFFNNTLEFPFFYEKNGMNILRAPTAANEDGSLLMTADIETDVRARIAYGDPWTILDDVRQGCVQIGQFQPEVIQVFSCAARRTFWGSEAYKETLPMQTMAPTSGFYTSGEFLRSNNDVNQHNVTLVCAAMREGGRTSETAARFEMTEEQHSGKVSMINRLATFIEAATEELETMAKTDGLTGLFNRREIQQRITRALERHPRDTALIMIDADYFKHVNDTYGHGEGDDVLKGLSDMIRRTAEELPNSAYAGRWGGEEFMLCLTGEAASFAEETAERIRREFEDHCFPLAGHQTVSIGLTYLRPNETTDSVCTRVDEALYEAKKAGRNRICTIK